MGGEGGNKEKVKLGGGAAASFCFPDLGLSGGRRGGASPVLGSRASYQGPCPKSKGPRVLRTCRRPTLLVTEPIRVPFQGSLL